ncbi:MAG TPA: hypothetical protein HA226_02475 [Nanoarchaeota archaeon]|nr:MAG: hypothetical protein QT09_C0007G0071 [archaeon GW2011_AR18]HIH25612.1 hypothetical protein [Nanoarchaeota archaeon]
MHTKIREDYEKLIKSGEFNKEGYLCGFFLMSEVDKLENTDWQIDFYDEKKDTITSYVVGEKIEVSENSKIFKEEGKTIEELKLEKLKVDIKDALRKCEIILKQHEEKETQVIIILQNDKGIKWNISYVTQKFNLINIKIDAETGELVNQNIISMLSWGKIDDGKD